MSYHLKLELHALFFFPGFVVKSPLMRSLWVNIYLPCLACELCVSMCLCVYGNVWLSPFLLKKKDGCEEMWHSVVMTASKWKDQIIMRIMWNPVKRKKENEACFLASYYHIMYCRWWHWESSPWSKLLWYKMRNRLHQVDTFSLLLLLFCDYFHAVSLPERRSDATRFKPRPTLSTYILWLHFLCIPTDTQAGRKMCYPTAPTMWASSCSIFPDKYHLGQFIRDISPFLRC